jgi:hypothetical protein
MPRKLLRNWITEYVEAMDPISEAPNQYIIWSAISVISAILKKNVWVWRGTYQVYPNQYIILVGPPGVGKGSAIHPAHGFVKNFKVPKLSNYLSDRITAEEIIKRLEQGFPTIAMVNGNIVNGAESTAVLMAAELSTFLSSSEWMTGFLCDCWDRNDFEYGTKNKGSNSITGMCVSLIGACVPDFIRKINGKTNSSEAINSGFTARTIFVFANEKSKKLPWPVKLENTRGGPEMIANLRNDLEHIASLKGEYTFAQDAKDLFTQWYNKLGPTDTDSDVIRHFKSRQDVHVMKVAMCFAAATSDNMEIDRWCLTTAIALVQGVLNTLDVTFRGVGESSLSEATAKVQSYMERKGLASRAELVRDMSRHATMEDLDRIIFTLETIGILKKPIISGRQYYEHTNSSTKTKGATP